MTTAVLEPKRTRKRRKLIWLVPILGWTLLILPVVLLAGAGNPPCPGTGAGTPNASTPAGGPAPGGMFAQPLKLQQGHWYEVGATQYGGPADPSSSDTGAITVPGQGYLPAHPDTFAELSVLDSNPANGGTFTFADANALNNLPYLTALIVANNGTKKILEKRDVGYGQGPGQTIANGQPYRLDVWWQSAGPLGVSKNAVSIALAPPLGTSGVLGQSPAGAATVAGPNPICDQLAASGTLQLVPGQQARILANGNAAAPADAPRAVKLAVAAANQIDAKYYNAQRPEPLNTIYPWYDCSASTDYVLYHAGLNAPGVTVDGVDAGNSTLLEGYGQDGPGKWISIYANSDHAFIVIAGLAFDTADFGGPNIPAGTGPRWRQNPLANLQDGLSYVVRHPVGL
jgi:hypothetical protein